MLLMTTMVMHGNKGAEGDEGEDENVTMSVTLLPGVDDENDSIMFIRKDLEGGRGT